VLQQEQLQIDSLAGTHTKSVHNYYEVVSGEGKELEVQKNGTDTDGNINIKTEQSFNVYCGDGGALTKLDENGDVVWTYGASYDVVDTAVDSNGYVYYSTADGENVVKLDPEGNKVWEFTGRTGAVWNVDVDANGYVYSALYDDTVRKISPEGNEVWYLSYADSGFYSVAVDVDRYVYAGTGGLVW